jgi:Flp pilus assembly protein TadG
MRTLPLSAAPLRARLLNKLVRLGRNEDGTTAIEFAAVAVPFFMFVFGIIGISMHYFVMNSIEKGMDQASRLIRTGQAQTNDFTVGQFKSYLCNKANSRASTDAGGAEVDLTIEQGDGHIKCNDLEIFIQNAPNWQNLTPEPCVNVSGTKRVNTTNPGDPLASYAGTESDVVLVTACYEWQFTKKIPFLTFDTPDNAMIMQSATAFRTEPYAATSAP